MSLIYDGVWKAGVWAQTAWADDVWFESAPPQGTLTPARARRAGEISPRPLNISSSTRQNTSGSRRPKNY